MPDSKYSVALLTSKEPLLRRRDTPGHETHNVSLCFALNEVLEIFIKI